MFLLLLDNNCLCMARGQEEHDTNTIEIHDSKLQERKLMLCRQHQRKAGESGERGRQRNTIERVCKKRLFCIN
jgi:hypothetical protein